MTTDKVACRTPAEGRDGVTNIPKWKYDALEQAIRAVLSNGPTRFSGLKEAVRPHLSDDILSRLGSLGWHTTVVKLEMEVRGDVVRLPGKGPQTITLGPTAPVGG